MLRTKKEIVYVILAGIFITNAVTTELIGGKLIQVGPFVLSMGFYLGLLFLLLQI